MSLRMTLRLNRKHWVVQSEAAQEYAGKEGGWVESPENAQRFSEAGAQKVARVLSFAGKGACEAVKRA